MPDVSPDPPDEDVHGHIKYLDVDALMLLPPSDVESVPPERVEPSTEPEAVARRRWWRRAPRGDRHPSR